MKTLARSDKGRKTVAWQNRGYGKLRLTEGEEDFPGLTGPRESVMVPLRDFKLAWSPFNPKYLSGQKPTLSKMS